MMNKETLAYLWENGFYVRQVDENNLAIRLDKDMEKISFSELQEFMWEQGYSPGGLTSMTVQSSGIHKPGDLIMIYNFRKLS